MQVAIHLGAHATSGDLLRHTLLANAETLKSHGLSCVDPDAYRVDLETTTRKFEFAPPPRVQKRIAAKASSFPDPGRIVISYEDIICPPERVFRNGLLYNAAANVPALLRAMFSQHEVSFFLALRNPATFIPSVFDACLKRPTDLGALLQGANLDLMRWSDVVFAIREAAPDCPLTVWCHEDSPFIWPQLLHAVAGLSDPIPIRGEFDIIKQIMTPEGMQLMLAELSENRPDSMQGLMLVIARFLEDHAIEEEVVQTLDLPGWTPEIVASLTRDYNDDLPEIAAMEGVRMIMPDVLVD